MFLQLQFFLTKFAPASISEPKNKALSEDVKSWSKNFYVYKNGEIIQGKAAMALRFER